jgi:hypothetical protein
MPFPDSTGWVPDSELFPMYGYDNSYGQTAEPAAPPPATGYDELTDAYKEQVSEEVWGPIVQQVEAAVSGAGPPIQIGSRSLGPGATPEQISDATKMLAYRAGNPVENWSTSDVLTKLVRGGAKAVAGAAIIAGGMTLAGVGWGAGAGGASGGAGAAAADGLTGVTTGGASYLPGGAFPIQSVVAGGAEGLAQMPAWGGAGEGMLTDFLGIGGSSGGDALTGVTVPSAGNYINTALPYTNGPAAGAFGTGAGGLGAGIVDAAGNIIPGTEPGYGTPGAAPPSPGGILDSSGVVIPGTEGYIGPLANALGNASGVGSAADIAGGLTGGGNGLTNALGDAAGTNWPGWITDALLPGINSLLGANAADKAAEAQERAALAAVEEQRRQYDQSRADLQPWLTAGQGALGRLQDPNAFQASPSYDFRRNEGMRGIENSFAAGGMGQSGNALKALADFNSGLASQEHGQWWNQQAGLAGVGQTAGTNLGQLGQNTAANVGNALSQYGDARASGYLGRSAAFANGINDGMYNYLYRRQR